MALVFKSSMDDTQFQHKLNHMEHSVKESSERMKMAFESVGAIGGAFGASVLLEGVEGLAEHFRRLKDQAESVDIPVEEYQRLAFVFQQAGTDSETFQKGMAHLTESLVKARDETSKEAHALADLGLSLDNTNEADATGALSNLADAYSHSEDKGRAFADITDLIGMRIVTKMIPALAGGGEEFRRLAASADVASDSVVQMGVKAGQAIDAWKTTILNKAATTAVEVGSAFAKNFEKGWNDASFSGDGFMRGIVGSFMGAASALGLTAHDAFTGNGPGGGAVDNGELKNLEHLAEEQKAKQKSIEEDIQHRLIMQEERDDEESMIEVLTEQIKKGRELIQIEKERAAWRQTLMSKQDQLAEAEKKHENEIQKRSANDDEQMFGNRANRMEKERKEELDRFKMSAHDRHAADRQMSRDRRAEDRFDRTHPNERRAIEQARRLEQEAKQRVQKLEATLSSDSIDKLKSAIELLIAK